MVNLSRRQLVVLMGGSLSTVERMASVGLAQESQMDTQWRAPAEEAARNRPVHQSGTLYIPGNNLTAINSDDGDELWAYNDSYPTQGRPSIAGDIIAVPVGPDNEPRPDSRSSLNEILPSERFDVATHGQDEIVGLKSGNGTKKWEFRPSDFGFLRILNTDASTIYVGEFDDNPGNIWHRVYALDKDDGKVKWSTEVGDVFDSQSFLYKRSLITTSDSALTSLTDGSVDWRYNAGTTIWAPKKLDNKAILQTSDGLSAVNLESGELSWELDAETLILGDTVSTWDSMIYFGSTSGTIMSITSNGMKEWTTDVESKVLAQPVVTQEMIYTIAENTVFSHYRDSGDIKWSTKFNHQLSGVPILVGEDLYIQISPSPRSTQTVKIEAASGQIKSRFAPDAELTFAEPGMDGIFVSGSNEYVYKLN